MRRRLWLLAERYCCTCWISARDWTWSIPLGLARYPSDDDWMPRRPVRSVGSVAFSLESRILCAAWFDEPGE